MSFKITGSIHELENNRSVSGLVVTAYDKDFMFNDVLGNAITDDDGKFEITYKEKDFKQFFDNKPDIYITVKSKDGRTVYTTEKDVRMEAGKTEHFEIRIPKDVIEGKDSTGIGLRFSRKMSGFFLENTDDFQRGERVGRRRKNRIEIRCRITIDDIYKFLKEPYHTAQLSGQIDYGDLGNNLPMQNGIFNLFSLDTQDSMRKIIYRFHFNSKSGQTYLFSGEKYIHREQSSSELLKDITTLYAKIYHGFSSTGRISGSGILGFKARSIIDIFDSLEVINARNSIERVGSIAMFYGFIYKELEDIYVKR